MEEAAKRLQMDCLNKCFKYISNFDSQIKRNLKEAGYETRPVQSNGLWCPLLLPLILLLYTWTDEVSTAYKIAAYVSLGLLSYSILFIAFLTISCIVIKETIYGGCTASSLITGLLVYLLAGQGLLFSFFVAFSSTWTYSHFLRLSFHKVPKTFTVGEAMVVIQGAVLFCVASVSFLVEATQYDEETKIINTCIYVMYITEGIIITLLFSLKSDQRNVNILGEMVTIGAIFIGVMLCCIFGPSSIAKFLYFIVVDDIYRIQLIGLWLFLLGLAALAVILRTKTNKKADTVTRKIFHILASSVFLIGIITDLYLIKLAAGIGFGLLIFIEAIRKSCIKPLAPILQSAFETYSDEKDCGSFAMTPLYLYVGLACPILLVPHNKSNILELLSGVLSIGIGDSAASWIGSQYGRNKWPGSDRTMEGTAANIISQVVMVYFLGAFDYLHSKNGLIRSMIASSVSSLIEAETQQVDNLILPLVTLISYRLTWFLL